jgi:hypothetical protein
MGILVVSPRIIFQHEISVGEHVEIRIEWPALLDRRIPLQLLGVVWVIRRRAFSFAASFERNEFRTMVRLSQQSIHPAE